MYGLKAQLLGVLASFLLLAGLVLPASVSASKTNCFVARDSGCCMAVTSDSRIDSCCCRKAPEPKKKDIPVSGGFDSSFYSIEPVLLGFSYQLTDSFDFTFNMAGWTTGLEKPAPPPVKMYLLVGAFLC